MCKKCLNSWRLKGCFSSVHCSWLEELLQPWRPLWLWGRLCGLNLQARQTASKQTGTFALGAELWFGKKRLVLRSALTWTFGGFLSIKKGGGGRKERKRRRRCELGKTGGGWGGGSFTYHNSPNSEMHLALFEDLIIHPAAKQHSSTHADKGKSLLQPQIHHVVKNRRRVSSNYYYKLGRNKLNLYMHRT